jgi:hypothetical protein
MTLKELQSGTKFRYGITSHYTLEWMVDMWVVCQFGNYVANVEEMTDEYIKAFTYIMSQKVDIKINLDECIDMEQERNRDFPLQEMVDEYGIGAYEEEN